MNDSNSNNGFGSHSTNDDQSQYKDTGNSLRDHLQLDRTTEHFCIIFPLDIGHFEIKYRVRQFLRKFHGMDAEPITTSS